MGLQNSKRWFDSILVRQFLESRLMAGHRPLNSADVGSTPTFPTILFTGGLLVSQSRFEREPRRSDSYSVIHCKEVPPSLLGCVRFVLSCPRLGIWSVKPMDESPSGCSITIWTVVEVRRRPGLDGRRLLADSDIRIIGWQHLAFVISDATAIVRAPGVRS
jgi:hypothetical protein